LGDTHKTTVVRRRRGEVGRNVRTSCYGTATTTTTTTTTTTYLLVEPHTKGNGGDNDPK
jgi:hypothetical protein